MDITSHIELLKNQRSALLLQLNGLSNETLRFIPEGSNNNILWNLGHILVIPQFHLYSARQLDPHIPQHFIQNYMSGTKPGSNNIDLEFREIKELLLPILDLLKSDFDKGMFKAFKAFGNLDFTSTLELLIKHESGHIAKINQILTSINTVV